MKMYRSSALRKQFRVNAEVSEFDWKTVNEFMLTKLIGMQEVVILNNLC